MVIPGDINVALEKGGFVEVDVDELCMGEEHTNPLSYVTMRKSQQPRKAARVLRTNEADVNFTNPKGGTGIDGFTGMGPSGLYTNTLDSNLPEGEGICVDPNAGKFQSSTTNTTNDHVVTITSKHDFIEGVIGVSLKSASDIDLFLKELEAGKHPIWPNLDSETRSQVYDAMCDLCEGYGIDMKAAATNSAESVCNGVNVSIPRRVVEKVSARLEHTLYGYFIGNRMAFLVVEYFVRNNWAKYGLKKIMMNAKGFFFFKFDTQSGLESVLEDGPWMIRKSPIILKQWSIDTSLCKEELTCIPIWVKLHDVPIQVFEDDGINLIASFIGKPIMLDSYTSSMCKDSWGRSSFARCLIEVGSEDELVEVITIGVPSLTGDGFTKESIRVEYE